MALVATFSSLTASRIAGVQFCAVQFDRTFGHMHPRMTFGLERMFNRVAGIQPGEEQFRVLIDRDGILSPRLARDEMQLPAGLLAKCFRHSAASRHLCRA